MKRFLILVLVVIGLSLVLVPTAVLAKPTQPTFGTFVNDNGVPAGSSLVLNITYNVTNDEDSGNAGYWALDNYNKTIQVWQAPDGTFYAVARYAGKWQTFAGAMSPGAGVPITKDASGTFEGGWVGTFSATGFTSAFGNIGTYDFGGTKADILLGTYGAGQTGPTTVFDWMSKYFTGVSNFNQSQWGWTYHYRSQTWNNFYYGTTGDIVP